MAIDWLKERIATSDAGGLRPADWIAVNLTAAGLSSGGRRSRLHTADLQLLLREWQRGLPRSSPLATCWLGPD